MTKSEFVEKNGLSVRRVTPKDREQASTDYQRAADFIISHESGYECYSKRATMDDLKWVMKMVRVKEVSAIARSTFPKIKHCNVDKMLRGVT